MAKRQKRIKQKGRERIWSNSDRALRILKKSSGPSVGAIAAYKDRARSLADGAEPMAKFLNTPRGKYEIRGRLMRNERIAELHRKQHIEREYISSIVDQVLELLGETDPDYCVVLQRTRRYVWRMYFINEHEDSCFFIVQHDTLLRTIKRSVNYSSSEIAKTQFITHHVEYQTRFVQYEPVESSG